MKPAIADARFKEITLPCQRQCAMTGERCPMEYKICNRYYGCPNLTPELVEQHRSLHNRMLQWWHSVGMDNDKIMFFVYWHGAQRLSEVHVIHYPSIDRYLTEWGF